MSGISELSEKHCTDPQVIRSAAPGRLRDQNQSPLRNFGCQRVSQDTQRITRLNPTGGMVRAGMFFGGRNEGKNYGAKAA
jgi:hypothetical protein